MIEKYSLLKRIDKAYLSSDLDEEMTLMDMKSNEYIGMDKTTTQNWKFLNEPQNINILISHFTSIYEVSEEQCENDVRPVLEDMVERCFLIMTTSNEATQ